MFKPRLAFAALFIVCLPAIPIQAEEKLKAVASFSVIADMVEQVGGDSVEVTQIVGPGGDAHVYEPTPNDAKLLASADVVFVNGLGFEGWLDRLVKASGYAAAPVILTEGIKPGTTAEGEHHGEADGHDHGGTDPHAWQSVALAQTYVANIAKGLCAADSAHCESYKVNAARYAGELAGLDAEIKAAVERIPADRRVVISSHDAFGYFAREYGVSFLAPEGISTESEASAQDVARLIEQIRHDKASALFVENISDPRLIEQIARETGLKIGGELYSDALSPKDGPAPTYLAMMRHNIGLLAAAMAGM